MIEPKPFLQDAPARRRLLHILGALTGAAALCLPARDAAGQGASPSPGYVLEDAFPDLKFDQPLGIVSAPGDKRRLFVLEKAGRIQVLTGLDTPKPVKEVFLDLAKLAEGRLETGSECGLLGLAFPPDYAASKRCFVYYSLRSGGRLYQRVSRFALAADNPDRADKMKEQPLFTQQDEADNHNGGDLQFGPDGCLYVSAGDGGVADDKLNQARFINKGFHAGILRIDADKKAGSVPPNPHPGIARDAKGEAFYSIPPDNPFIGATSYHGQTVDPQTVRTEFWATGLRNPWRIFFDPPSGRLFTGDVGQILYEEVDIIVKGGDYGWSYREGLHPFPQGPGKDDEPADFKPVAPIYEYPRTVGISVTGGAVYRGDSFPKLKGAYIFADYGTGVIIALRENGSAWTPETLAREPGIAAIGLDPRDGAVLFANLAQGKIQRFKSSADG